MSESESNTRPMRKLSVRNFSVIKRAELEFGKITVLIGPQSSGKSLLCKLAYFLGKEIVILAAECVRGAMPWLDYVRSVENAFGARFSVEYDLAQKGSAINFESNDFVVDIGWKSKTTSPTAFFALKFREVYEALLSFLGGVPPASGAYVSGEPNPVLRQYEIWSELNKVLFPSELEESIFIPASRSLFMSASMGFTAIQNSALDPITKEFSTLIEWDSRWKSGMLTTGRDVNNHLTRMMSKIASGFVMVDAGTPVFLTEEGRKITFDKLSTGVQELSPFFNVVEQLIFSREAAVEQERAIYRRVANLQSSLVHPSPTRSSARYVVYIEEPEAHVFPATQYDLVRLMTWIACDPILNFDWIITTHSPYILSVFSDLLKAGKISAQNPRQRSAIAQIIPDVFWIRNDLFFAYKIEDGKLESIFDRETGQIDGDYLDNVSGKISDELGQLLEIQYGKA